MADDLTNFDQWPPEMQQRWKETVAEVAKQWADDFDAKLFNEVYALVYGQFAPEKPHQ